MRTVEPTGDQVFILWLCAAFMACVPGLAAPWALLQPLLTALAAKERVGASTALEPWMGVRFGASLACIVIGGVGAHGIARYAGKWTHPLVRVMALAPGVAGIVMLAMAAAWTGGLFAAAPHRSGGDIGSVPFAQGGWLLIAFAVAIHAAGRMLNALWDACVDGVGDQVQRFVNWRTPGMDAFVAVVASSPDRLGAPRRAAVEVARPR